MMKQDDSINIGMGGVGLWRRYVRLRPIIFAQRHGTINDFCFRAKRLQQRNHDEQSASISVVLVGSSLLRFFLFASSLASSLAASLASSFTPTGPGNQ